MPIVWRVDPMALMKESGYTSYRLRMENLLSQTAMQNMRHRKPVSWSDLEVVCRVTGKQPGKLIGYVNQIKDTPPEDEE